MKGPPLRQPDGATSRRLVMRRMAFAQAVIMRRTRAYINPATRN
jgi:hypothetical protein